MRHLVAYPAIHDDEIHGDESNKQAKTRLEEDLSK
jgi:hypothetical protein